MVRREMVEMKTCNQVRRIFHDRYPAQGIVARARHRIQESDRFRHLADRIQVDAIDGSLVLHGNLPSFFMKQMLQTILRDIEGVKSIENHVEVGRQEAVGRKE